MENGNLTKSFFHGGDYFPEQWLNYPDILKKDFELISKAKMNTVTVGMFAWGCLEPEEGNYSFDWLDDIFERVESINGNIILATPSAARPAWMAQKYPEVLRVNENRQKCLFGGRHNHCFTSSVYREKVQKINRRLAQRYGNRKSLLMWHVSNEYGGECHCELCQNAFRHWLQKKYKTLKDLNNAWWGNFWSHQYSDWSQIESPSSIGESMNHGLNLDWKRFVTEQTIDFYRCEIEPLREITPNIPITTNFMAREEDMLPYEGLDYQKFAKYVDVVSWDCYPTWHCKNETTAELASKVGFMDDLFRSMKQKPFFIMESTPSLVNWRSVNKAKRPGMHVLTSLQHIAHGSNSNMYFQIRQSRGGAEKFHGSVLRNDNRTDTRVFKDVQQVGHIQEVMRSLTTTFRKSEIAIIYDFENNWAINDAQAFSKNRKEYAATVQEHYRVFWNRDLPVDVISVEADLREYRLVIVPMLYMMSATTLQRFIEYVNAGGVIVSTYLSGLVDKNDLTHMGIWPEDMKRLFGVELLENDTYYPGESNEILYDNRIFKTKDYQSVMDLITAKSLGTYGKDFYAKSTAVSGNRLGKGRAYFIGARTDGDFLDAFYGNLCVDLNLNQAFIIEGDNEVSVQSRNTKSDTYYFVMNFSESEKTIYTKYPSRDIVNNENCGVKIVLKPYEVKVLHVESIDINK
ncbi:beta-galactosidase [Enterococcus cecorum]|uniref:beta-galactosidase n=1 Tax=Enterococcus cecorum TaxID=44008 RepID=UPI00200A6048|nr:beta-galactosidase [Enterococcus cecorum]